MTTPSSASHLLVPLNMDEIIEVGKAILPYIDSEQTTNVGAIAHNASWAVMQIIRARAAAAPASPPSVRDRLEAFRSGWDDGYAEGYGKAKSEAAAPASPPSEVCEGCHAPAVTHDSADVPLCRECAQAMVDDAAPASPQDEKLRAALRDVLWMAEEWFKHGGGSASMNSDEHDAALSNARKVLGGDHVLQSE